MSTADDVKFLNLGIEFKSKFDDVCTRERIQRLLDEREELITALRTLHECYCEAGPQMNQADRYRHRLAIISANRVIAKATETGKA